MILEVFTRDFVGDLQQLPHAVIFIVSCRTNYQSCIALIGGSWEVVYDFICYSTENPIYNQPKTFKWRWVRCLPRNIL